MSKLPEFAIVHVEETSIGRILNPLEQQLARLHALWDLALSEESSDTQLDGVLREALAALACDYVEVWSDTDRKRVACTPPEKAPRPIGASALARNPSPERPVLLFRDPNEKSPEQEILRALGWGTVLVRTFTAGDVRVTLSFAWHEPRQTFVTETELRYVDFLAHVISRLLELAEKRRQVNEKILLDPLTGLHNRAATLEHVTLMLSSAHRTGGRLALLYVDLDGFKAINDSRGHAFGDAAIAEAARRMRSTLRRHEIAGRIGGDEFAVLVSFSDEAELKAIAERMLEAIAEPLFHEGVEVNLSASVGIALYPEHAATTETLLEHADAAMYVAKRKTAPAFAFYDAAATVPLATQPKPPRARSSEAERDFILCFQPIVEARTRRIVAAEALIRWIDPVRGLLLPEAPPKNGGPAIMPAHVDRAVIAALLESDKYAEAMSAIPIHVNVNEPADDLLSNDSAIGAELAVEIPEDLVAADSLRYTKFIARLRERGLRVGLSNFGYSGLSLRVLADLNLDFVKIGQKLIPGSAFETGSPAAAKAAIKQAHYFGWSVIAENVEDEAQWEWLTRGGVDALQGYYICSPLTQHDFANWLTYRQAQ